MTGLDTVPGGHVVEPVGVGPVRAEQQGVERAGAAATALHLQDLSWRPVSRREPTIDRLDLDIPAGQRVLLAGASGSGKSTVLRALAALLDPQAGDLSGQASAPQRPGERGMLLQNPVHALVGASVGRDAAFGPENAGMSRPLIQERAAEALDAACVDLDADHPPLDASGGQQQRIALAGALALAPGALLLDEPTSMLDEPTADAVRAAVLAVSAGRTLVVAEHRLGPWLPHVDRLVVLGPQARVIADGAPDQLLAQRRGELIAAGLDLPPVDSAGPVDDAGPVDIAGPVNARDTDPARDADPAGGSQPLPPPPLPDGVDASPVLVGRGLEIARRGEHRRRSRRRTGRTGSAPLLHDIDVTLRPGSVTVLTGPSGAGKTTLLRVLLGLERPLAGSLERPAREDVAWVPQNPEHGFVARTVRDEVLASPWARDEHLADALLERADLTHLARANPFALSGGEQRRLAIVAALAQRPRLLVLDEPTVGLDARRRADVLALLAEARADACAVLVATHDAAMQNAANQRIDLPAPEQGPRVTQPSRTIGPIPRSRPVPADALNPLTLCLIGILAAIGSFAATTWQVGLLSVVPLLLLIPLTARGPGSALLRLSPVLFSSAGLAWTTALLGGAPPLSGEAWLLGVKEACRVTAFAAPGVLTVAAIDPTALGDALGGRLRMPGRVVATSVAGLVRMGHVRRQWDTIMQARVLRGLGTARSVRLLASATLALLVDGLRGAELQAVAMDARGFATATARTWALPSRFRTADAAGVLLGVLLLVWPTLARMLVG